MAGYDTYVSPVNRAMALGQSIESQKTARQAREQSAEMAPINKRIATLQGDRLQADMDRFKEERNMRSMLDAAMQYSQIQDPAAREAFLDRRIALGQSEGRDMRDTIAFKNSPPAEREAQVSALMQYGQAQGLLPQQQASGSQVPSSVKEYEYYQGLTPEQQQEFMSIKRATPAAKLLEVAGQKGVFDPSTQEFKPLSTQSEEIAAAAKEASAVEASKREAGMEADIKAAATPGTPENLAMLEAKRKEEARAQSKAKYRAVVNDDINRALEYIEGSPLLSTGFIGGMTSAIPGSPSYKLGSILAPIKGNISFDRLSEMRQNSPTGGALGNVSNFEVELLGSVMGRFDQGMDADMLKYNLNRLKDLMNLVVLGDESGATLSKEELNQVKEARELANPPEGIDPEVWKFSTPEERALWK